MSISNLINDNEEYINDAINNGIDANAVNSTVEDMINKADEIGKTPIQVKESIETIVSMKNDVDSKVDENYSSEFVKNNSSKIISALNDGITSNEVVSTLINSTNNANTKKDKKHLKFVIKLVSKMKKKELVLNKQNVEKKSYQKKLIK